MLNVNSTAHNTNGLNSIVQLSVWALNGNNDCH